MLNLAEILKLPKCELHLHLEGLVSIDSLWQLQQRHRLNFPGIADRHALQQRMRVTSLSEFIDCFINVVQASFLQPNDLDLLFDDLACYLQRNDICYAEVFFSPSKFIRNGMAYNDIGQIIQQGVERIWQQQQRMVRVLIDVSRSFGVDNAQQNLQLMLANPYPAIIGIGLGGDERNGPASEFRWVFERAAECGLHRVAHAGEDVGPHSIAAAVNQLHVERIGHATSLIEDRQLLARLADQAFAIEACPTSNVFTGRYVQQYHQHPLPLFLSRGLCVSANSDDPSFFNTELNDELRKLTKYCRLNPQQILQLLHNAIDSSFAPTDVKINLKNCYQEATKNNSNNNS